MKRKALNISLFLVVSLLALSQTAPIANLTMSFNDSGATSMTYEKFHVISATDDFTLTASSEVVTPGVSPDYIHVGGTRHFVNFTHASLGAITNANQNFSLASGTNDCAANLNAIASDHVEVSAITSGCTVDFSYIMPAAYASLSIPQSVLYTYNGATQVIQQSSYFTSASSFSGCSTPCVFQNSANRTLIVKSPSSGAFTLDFYFPVYTAGGTSGVGPGGGGTSPPFTTTSAIINGTSSSTPTSSVVQIGVIAVIVIVVLALLLGRASDSKPFRSPGKGKASWNRMTEAA